MKCLKKGLGIFAVFMIFTALFPMTAFAEEDVVGERVSFKELKKSFEEKNKVKASLGAFDKNKEYDLCYGNQLDDNSKKVYDILVSNIEKSKDGVSDLGNEKTIVGGEEYDVIYFDMPYSELNKNGLDFCLYAIMAFDYDHPEVFWLNLNKIELWSGGNSKRSWVTVLLKLDCENYYCDGYTSYSDVKKDIDTIDEYCKGIQNEIKDMDCYNKLSRINSVLVDKNEYNRYVQDVIAASDDENEDNDTRIYKCVSALIYGNTDHTNKLNPVCEGYSRAFKVLCDKEGIECAIVSGGGHMWNYVKLPDEQKWYAVDVTWNDPVFDGIPSEDDIEKNKYRYFLIGYKSLIEGGGENKLNKHIESTDGIVYDKVFGIIYPRLEDDDYIYAPEENWIMGDVNKDGFVKADDASELLSLILNGGLTDYHKKVGNMDEQNPEITAADAAVIFKMVLEAD